MVEKQPALTGVSVAEARGLKSQRVVRWGVISTANIGRVAVIPAIKASRNGEVVAVASRDPEKGRAFAEALGIPQAYGSYEALLDSREVDAVYIPLPNSMHCEWASRAAECGKHVLCEKPLGLSSAQCLQMGEAAARGGVKLMEAFMYRFHPRTERVLEMVRNGALGALRLIHSSFTFRLTRPDNIRLKPELGGGALMDVGCYCVNISRTAAGTEPLEVQCVARWGNSGVDDQLAGTMSFPNGCIAQFDCSLSMERREIYTLAGTDGYITVPQAFLPGESDTMILEQRGRSGRSEHSIPGVDEYRLMVEHFADCVLEDRAPCYGADEAAANLRVIEALYRSARSGGHVISVQAR